MEGIYNFTMTIAEGGRYRIHPSEGFQGIDDGLIEVIALVHSSQVPEEQQDEFTNTYKDADGNIEPSAQKDYDELMNEPWVVYEYLDGEDHGRDRFYMPVEIFGCHITME